MRVILVAGHGDGDPGATSDVLGTNWAEANETRVMADLVAEALQARGVQAVKYPRTWNAYKDYKAGRLSGRLRLQRTDFLLEIHFNAFQKSTLDGHMKGCEIYVTRDAMQLGRAKAIVNGLCRLGMVNRGVKRQDFSVIKYASKFCEAALLEVCFIVDPDDMIY